MVSKGIRMREKGATYLLKLSLLLQFFFIAIEHLNFFFFFLLLDLKKKNLKTRLLSNANGSCTLSISES